MSAFPESGNSDHGKLAKIEVCFRPKPATRCAERTVIYLTSAHRRDGVPTFVRRSLVGTSVAVTRKLPFFYVSQWRAVLHEFFHYGGRLPWEFRIHPFDRMPILRDRPERVVSGPLEQV